jgi:hypothetical protein
VAQALKEGAIDDIRASLSEDHLMVREGTRELMQRKPGLERRAMEQVPLVFPARYARLIFGIEDQAT